MGIQPTLGVICSESFPTEIRNTSYGIVFALQYIALMVNVKLFPLALSSFGFYPVAYFYAAIAAMFTIWGMLTIKNTENLRLSKIQGMYSKKGVPELENMSYGSIRGMQPQKE